LQLEEMGCFPNYKTDGWLYSKVQDAVCAEPSPCSGMCGQTSPAACGSYCRPLPQRYSRGGGFGQLRAGLCQLFAGATRWMVWECWRRAL